MFSRFEAVVNRSLLLAITVTGTSLSSSGCYLFRPWPMHMEIREEKVDLSSGDIPELRQLMLSGARIPVERCAALCAAPLRTYSSWHFDGCYWANRVPTIECGEEGVTRELPSGTPLRYDDPIPQGLCQSLCGGPEGRCRWPIPKSIQCRFHAMHPAPAGRRPKGLRSPLVPMSGRISGRRTGRAAAAWFARCASLEAAAVAAFAELHEELCLLGASSALRAACQAALADECRHVRMMTELARAGGAEPEPPQIHRVPARSPMQLACDNAAEGCVRESFGAISALWQSVTAADPVVRGVMAQIAADETRHAELALALDAWLQRGLSDAERSEVAKVRWDAYVALRQELAGVDEATDPALGLPEGAQAQHLLDGAMDVLRASFLDNASAQGM